MGATYDARMDATVSPDNASEFLKAIQNALPTLVLTGAGVSVATGIPTYRDKAGVWLRSDPITHQEFVRNARQRQRYWGRSLIGWPAVRDARPAAAHRHLAQLQSLGAVTRIVTQNVDRLHQRAGSGDVTDLHGRLDRVNCLDCEDTFSRDQLQSRLERLNPHLRQRSASARPDGDADLDEDVVDSVSVPPCENCGGTLMPDVVFFGGNIPGNRVLDSQLALQRSKSLLVVGSSLQVYSGYRLCKWAAESAKPVFLMNPGRTRADGLGLKWAVEADTGLQALLERIKPRAATTPTITTTTTTTTTPTTATGSESL